MTLDPSLEVTQLRGAGVLITGASRGLGFALAEELGRRGARLALCARGPEIDEAARELRARGYEAHALRGDVGDKEAIHPLAGAAAALVGAVEVLVNNASELGPTPLRSLLDTECEDLARVLSVNLLGPFRLTRAVAGSMALGGRGTIVNISSDAAVEAYPRWGSYGVSKAALDQLTRIWAAELRPTGVRILAVDPGEMRTRMHAQALPEADPSALAEPAEVARAIAEMIADPRVEGGARVIASAYRRL